MIPIPQSILSHMGKQTKVKTAKIKAPKVDKSAQKSILKNIISGAKNQISGIKKFTGVKSAKLSLPKLMKTPKITSSKISTGIKRGLSRLG